MVACGQQFPTDDRNTIVAKVQCWNSAAAIVLPNFATNQDLLQTFMAHRALVAEQIQNGKMTIAEGVASIAEKRSQLSSEVQRRNAVAQSVTAQRQAANAQQQAAEAQQWTNAFLAGLAAWGSTPTYTAPQSVRVQSTCIHNGNMTFCN